MKRPRIWSFKPKRKIEEIANKEGLSGIPSGFTEVDKLTSGWQPSDLIIIAARPGMGKTASDLSPWLATWL